MEGFGASEGRKCPICDHPEVVGLAVGTRPDSVSEAVLDLLDNPPASFVKEDGEVVTPGKS